MGNPTINNVFPWGRSFDEYRGMFALTDADLERRIVGCGDGPAGFNATMAERGRQVVSCDPLYQFGAATIRGRIAATRRRLLASARRNPDAFVWDTIRSVEDLARIRRAAMGQFLADYAAGRAAGRYLAAALPHLPLPSAGFDFALCSHLLFLYSAQLPLEFHVAAVREMARVAREVRIFPLLDLAGRPSGHLAPVLAAAQSLGLHATEEPVAYEFLRGANQMLRLMRVG